MQEVHLEGGAMGDKSLRHTSRRRRALAWIVAGGTLSAGCVHGPPPRVGELGSEDLAVADVAIADAVRRELAAEAAVPEHQLGVAVEDGVVSIEGTVPDLLARERALRQAEAVRSVRAVIDRIRVTPEHRPDELISADVRASLADDPALAELPIEVSVERAQATLHGRVQSHNQRRLAELIASGVVGLRGVRNELTLSPGAARSDQQIAADIEARLTWDALVNGELVQVTVDDGVVTLHGTVGSAAEKSRVVADAWVAGVTRVEDDRVAVRWWARDVGDRGTLGEPTDSEIADAVRAAFRQDPRIHPPYSGSLGVVDGVVALSGMVASLREKNAASADARNTVGVREVINTLEVRATNQNPEATEQRLQRALARHPRLQGTSIEATVRGGVAQLTGTVELKAQCIVAQQLAERTLGVRSVQNALQARKPGGLAPYDPYSFSAAPYDGPGFQPLQGDARLTLSDHQLRERILGELMWNPLVDASHIDVRVQGAVAVLRGRVQSMAAQRAAVREAYQAGATAVEDRLRLVQRPKGEQ
jgi:osmotically-inducible protein OsmY